MRLIRPALSAIIRASDGHPLGATFGVGVQKVSIAIPDVMVGQALLVVRQQAVVGHRGVRRQRLPELPRGLAAPVASVVRVWVIERTEVSH